MCLQSCHRRPVARSQLLAVPIKFVVLEMSSISHIDAAAVKVCRQPSQALHALLQAALDCAICLHQGGLSKVVHAGLISTASCAALGLQVCLQQLSVLPACKWLLTCGRDYSGAGHLQVRQQGWLSGRSAPSKQLKEALHLVHPTYWSCLPTCCPVMVAGKAAWIWFWSAPLGGVTSQKFCPCLELIEYVSRAGQQFSVWPDLTALLPLPAAVERRQAYIIVAWIPLPPSWICADHPSPACSGWPTCSVKSLAAAGQPLVSSCRLLILCLQQLGNVLCILTD